MKDYKDIKQCHDNLYTLIIFYLMSRLNSVYPDSVYPDNCHKKNFLQDFRWLLFSDRTLLTITKFLIPNMNNAMVNKLHQVSCEVSAQGSFKTFGNTGDNAEPWDVLTQIKITSTRHQLGLKVEAIVIALYLNDNVDNYILWYLHQLIMSNGDDNLRQQLHGQLFGTREYIRCINEHFPEPLGI